MGVILQLRVNLFSNNTRDIYSDIEDRERDRMGKNTGDMPN